MPVRFIDEPTGKVRFLDEPIEKPKFDPLRGALNQPAIDIATQGREKLNNDLKGAFNTASFGIPRELIKHTTGNDIGEGSGIGQAAGLLIPGAGIAKGVSKIAPLAGKGIMKAAGRGALTGAITSQAITPEKGFFDIGERKQNAAVGATVGAIAEPAVPAIAKGIGNTFNSIRKAPKFISEMKAGVSNVTKNELPFVEKMASEFKSAERGLGKTFGSQLDDLVNKNPQNLGSAGEAIANTKEAMVLNPSLKSLINSKDTPTVHRLLQNPDIAENMTAKEMQNVINELSSQTTQRKLQGMGIRPNDNPFMGIINDFRDSQLSAFPEMGPIRQQFRTGKAAAKNLKPYFQEKALPRTIRGKMDENVILMRDAERLLPEDVFRQLRGAQNASKITSMGKTIGKEALTKLVPFGALGYALAKLSGRSQ